MSASILYSLDATELTKGLPSLICETDIEKQVVNIENWLKLFFPVNAIGLSLSGNNDNNTNVFTTNIRKEIIEEIVKHIEGFDQTDQAMQFKLIDGSPVVSDLNDHGQPFGDTGIAISLINQGSPFGKFFLITDEPIIKDSSDQIKLQSFISLLSSLVYNAYSHHQKQEKMRLLNLYETVSSSLCYAGDLQELLTMIISIVVSELPSEEGSILLYDDETNELEFFSAIGDTGAGLVQLRFPADKGIAGKALQDGQAVIVNNVQTCPYFFGKIDNESGFVTRSILAAPIIAGGEKVGVIEAINKVGESSFTDEDGRILMAIADEVGLAVKNARMFDYVVNSYCKLRQGITSCKGCVRPLKSWTPCARQLDLL